MDAKLTDGDKPQTFFVPGRPLRGQNLKEGATVTLEVVSVDPENGDLEVRVAQKPMEPEEELRPMLEEAFQVQGKV